LFKVCDLLLMKLKVQEERWDLIANWCSGECIMDFGSYEGEAHNYIEKKIGRKIVRVDRYGEVEIRVNFDINMNEIKSESANTIIVGYVLEHLYYPFNFLKECHRILKNKGRIIITIPNMSSLPYFLDENKDIGEHIHGWNMPMLEHYMKIAGFNIIFKKKINAWYNKNILFRLLCWIIPNWKACIVMVGERIF